jgi:hypothetical protein
VVAGGLPFVVLVLAYCAHVTGSPLRLPLSASDPLDTFGFGPRRILPSETTFAFTRRAAFDALRETVAATPGWLFGGVVTAVLAFTGLFAPSRRGLAARAMLAATVLAVFGGYSFWWGSAFAVPGLVNGLGPHYHLAAFTPMLLLAAFGVRWVWLALTRLTRSLPAGRWPKPALLAASAIALSALSAVTAADIPVKVATQRHVNDGDAHLEALLPDDMATPAAVVVTPGEPSRYTQVPYQTLRNDPELSGPVIYAVDRGAATVGLPEAVPGRHLYRLRPDEILDPAAPASFYGTFVTLRVVEGRRIDIQLTIHLPSPAGAGTAGTGGAGEPSCGTMYVRLADRTQLLTGHGEASGAFVGHIVLGTGPASGLGPDGLSVDGMDLPAELAVGCVGGAAEVTGWLPGAAPGGGAPGSATLGASSGASGIGASNGASRSASAATVTDAGAAGAWWWEERIPLGIAPSGDLRLLTPGLGWRLVPGRHDGSWIPASVDKTLTVTTVPVP